MEPLTNAARAALIALVRVIELYDPAVAHRSAVRSLVADRLATELGLSSAAASLGVATSAMADIDLSISRPTAEDARRDAGRSVLAATLVDRIPHLGVIAKSLRHVGEHWDGSGVPLGLTTTDIPLGARMAAVTDAVVGNPACGYMPTWAPALTRVKSLAGSRLDPSIVDALLHVQLDRIEQPIIPSAAVGDLLEQYAPTLTTPSGSVAAVEVATAVAAAARAEDLLELFADIARRSVDAADVAVLRMTRTSIEDTPLARSVDGREPALDLRRLADLTDFTTVAELRAGEAVVRTTFDDGYDAEGASRLRSLGIGSEMTVPIMLGDEAWGFMSAARRLGDRLLDEHDLGMLGHIAEQAGSSLSNTVRWERIEHMALRDQLTGLSNRHVLYTVLDDIFERDPIDRLDCAVIMCDVDGLKIVNDNLGHEAGDRLLIDASIALRGAVRDPDHTTICRIGGDEFCLVIDGGALLTAHEVSDTIEQLFERSGTTGSERSISCGIAFAGPEIENRSQLLRAADENQYETKRARRAARGEPIETGSRGRGGDRRAIRD